MLASKSGLPMLPAGIGYSGAWRARSWDRLAIPKPFSRIVFVLGESVRVPQEIDRSGINHYRRIVETRMLEATEEAERLAAGTNRASKPHFGFARARARREGTPAGPERPGDRPAPSPRGA